MAAPPAFAKTLAGALSQELCFYWTNDSSVLCSVKKKRIIVGLLGPVRPEVMESRIVLQLLF